MFTYKRIGVPLALTVVCWAVPAKAGPNVYLETPEPIMGWLNYRIEGPANPAAHGTGRATYTVYLEPVDWQERPHRYRWSSVDDLAVSVFTPAGVTVQGGARLEYRPIHLREREAGPWAAATRSPDDRADPRIADALLDFLSQSAPKAVSWTLSIASGLELVNRATLVRDALRKARDADAQNETPLRFPLIATDDYAAAFRLHWAMARSEDVDDDAPVVLIVKVRMNGWGGGGSTQYHALLFRPFTVPTPPAPAGPGQRPANWPSYLRDFRPPQGMSWSSFRVSPKDGMPQALIPAGEFMMGSPDGEGDSDEHPQKRVYVSAFWMDVHEVTNRQFTKFVQVTRYHADSDWQKWSGDTIPLYPAVYVSWDDATAYARWAGRQLPTEAQWEKAARGGTTTIYPWGDAPDPSMANGNWQSNIDYTYGNAVRYCKPVGRYRPNAYGLFDMIGNVLEWCRDWYDRSWYERMSNRDPQNTTKAKYRVLRGGSWGLTPSYLRVAYRGRGELGGRDLRLGFRCSEAP